LGKWALGRTFSATSDGFVAGLAAGAHRFEVSRYMATQLQRHHGRGSETSLEGDMAKKHRNGFDVTTPDSKSIVYEYSTSSVIAAALPCGARRRQAGFRLFQLTHLNENLIKSRGAIAKSGSNPVERREHNDEVGGHSCTTLQKYEAGKRYPLITGRFMAARRAPTRIFWGQTTGLTRCNC